MIGIITGYMVGSLAADAEMFGIKEYFNWRRAIFTQGVALFIIALCFCAHPNEKLDILAEEKQQMENLELSSSPRRHFAESNFCTDCV